MGDVRVVVALIKKENKLLVAKRPEGKPYAGYWEFPGGKIEENEASDGALKRELHEELGIDVLTATFCFTHGHKYPDKKVSLELWLVSNFSGKPHPKENQLLRWVTQEELGKLNLLEGNLLLLDRIKNDVFNS